MPAPAAHSAKGRAPWGCAADCSAFAGPL